MRTLTDSELFEDIEWVRAIPFYQRYHDKDSSLFALPFLAYEITYS